MLYLFLAITETLVVRTLITNIFNNYGMFRLKQMTTSLTHASCFLSAFCFPHESPPSECNADK